jgi:hypothetical protein
MKETDELTRRFDKKSPIAKQVFAAHSESDDVASIKGIEDVEKVTAPGRFTFYRIPKAARVSHASLVLKDPIDSSDGKRLEEANPRFLNMLESIAQLTQLN